MARTKYKIALLTMLFFFCTGKCALNSNKQYLLHRYSFSYNKTVEENLIADEWLPGFSSLNLFSVGAYVLNIMNKLVKRGEHGLGTAFLHIRPKQLALLLQFNGELASITGQITNQTFFDTFSRFIVSFDGDNHEVIDYSTMEKLVRLVSEYNSKKDPAGTFSASKKLEIWIDIPATKDISNVVLTTLEAIKKTPANEKIVTTLLLNYRSLHLTAESTPVIQDDISLTKLLVENMFGLENTVKTGIILDVLNCPKFMETSSLYTLNLSKDIELVFMSQLHNVKKEIDNVSPTLSCFFSGKFVQAKISLKIPIKAVVSLENSSFSIISPRNDLLELYSFTSVMSGKERLILEAEVAELSGCQEVENSTRPINGNWLMQDTVFEKAHFGVSLSSPAEIEMFTKTIHTVFHHFRKIIVESRDPYGTYNASQLSNFVRSMAHYETSRVREAMSKGEVNIGEIRTQLLIVANIDHEDDFNSWNSVKGAFNAAVLANQEYPEIATVMFNVDSCDAKRRPDKMERLFFGSEYLNVKFLMRIRGVVQALREFKKQVRINGVKSEYVPKVGVISKHCMELTITGLASISKTVLGQAKESETRRDLILLKLPVQKKDIIEYGAMRTASLIIHASRNCDLMMLFFKKRQKFDLYIQLHGCSNRDNENTNIHELVEVAKFWELLNSWGVKENKTIYMGAGFEYPRKLAGCYDKCGCNSSVCGWWKIRNDTNDSTLNDNDWIWEDRKSAALRIYQKTKMVLGNPRKGHVTDVVNPIKIIMAVFIPTAIFLALVVMMSSYLIFRYRSKYLLSSREVTEFIRGEPVLTKENGGTDMEGGQAESQPYNKSKYEVSRSSFLIDFTRCLGSGEFATVMCGSIKRENTHEQVAVKMMRKRKLDGSAYSYHLALKGLISEIKILSYVGEHRNVVKMVGACTSRMRAGKLFVFLELCEFGSLNKYLRTYNPSAEEVGAGNIEMTSLALSSEIFSDLRRWSIEVASGMEYLSSKKIVHADLATRNILLDSGKCAKISDFGLSRRLYAYSEYLKKEAGPLPWRWMAPESLRRMIFNEKTDVWAFGVTLWEMYNLGDEPYPGLAWDVNFPAFLERGSRLAEPRFNEENVYALMKRCWEVAPTCRPTFTELREMLRDNAYVVVL